MSRFEFLIRQYGPAILTVSGQQDGCVSARKDDLRAQAARELIGHSLAKILSFAIPVARPAHGSSGFAQVSRKIDDYREAFCDVFNEQ